MERNHEFFKLDEVDRKVILWLIDHVQPNAIKSWIDYIAVDYKYRKAINIDTKRLFNETKEA